MSEEKEIPYHALKHAKGYAIFARGALAFRFGPFEMSEMGAIMTRCHDEGISALFTMDCGPELDWKLVSEMGSDAASIKHAEALLLTTARIVRGNLRDGMTERSAKADVADLDEMLRPFERETQTVENHCAEKRGGAG